MSIFRSLACLLIGSSLAAAQTIAAQPFAAPVTLVEAGSARAALDKLVHAYEAGDVLALRDALDPSMIGYQPFLDGVQRDLHTLQQIRIHLFEPQIATGPDVAQIAVVWEKRFVSANAAQPGLLKGRMLVLMHRTAQGWRLSAIAGDHPFSGQGGALASASITAGGLSRALLAGCSLPCNLPAQVEVVDPDLAQARSINVEIRTNQGDIEVITVPPISPGRFVRTGLIFVASGAAVPYSGAIEVSSSAGPLILTMRYLDQNPGAGRPPSMVVHTTRIGQ